MTAARDRSRSELGATSIEYAILAVLIGVGIIVAVSGLGQSTQDNLCPSGEGWEQIEAFGTADC